MRQSIVIKRSFILANKSRNGKQFSWGRRPELAIVDVVARIQGDLVMNASIPYFFWWWLSKICKKYDVARSTLSYFLQVVEPNTQHIYKLTSAQFCVVANKYPCLVRP